MYNIYVLFMIRVIVLYRIYKLKPKAKARLYVRYYTGAHIGKYTCDTNGCKRTYIRRKSYRDRTDIR